MILVDTSVLINFFKGVNNSKVQKLENIMIDKILFGINNYIYQEILQGAEDENEFNMLNEYLINQKFYSLNNGKKSYQEAAKMYFKCRKNGITIKSTIDLIIVQTAIENNLYLLHDDKDFSNIANVIKELKEY